MGLYSINRLTNMGFSNLLESVNNIEETVVEEAPLSLFEVAQYIQEEEQKIFDTVIAADFEELFKDTGLNKTINEETTDAANTEKKEEKKSDNGDKNLAQKIWEKIKEIAGKVKNAVIGAWNAISRKLEELFKADEKIIAKYKPAIEKCKDFNNFKFDETELALELDLNVIKKIVDGLTKIRDSISFDDKGTANDNSEEVTKILNDTVAAIEKEVKDGFKKYEKLSKDQILRLITILSHQKMQDLLKKLSDGSITIVKKIEAASNSTDGKDDTNKAHAKYEKVKVSSQSLVKISRLAIDAVRKNVTAARRILILAGRYALNETKDDANVEVKNKDKKKEEGKQEAALIAMASDLYVTEMLAM